MAFKKLLLALKPKVPLYGEKRVLEVKDYVRFDEVPNESEDEMVAFVMAFLKQEEETSLRLGFLSTPKDCLRIYAWGSLGEAIRWKFGLWTRWKKNGQKDDEEHP